MKTPDTNADDLMPTNQEKTCPVGSLPPPAAGIVGTAVDTGGQSVTIDYDPRLISDESVRQVATRLVPEGNVVSTNASCASMGVPVRRARLGSKGKHVHKNSTKISSF